MQVNATEIKESLAGVLEYFKQTAGEKWPEVEAQALEYLDKREQRLLNLANDSLTGQLEPKFLAARMEDELTILESEAISLGVMTASATQNVLNAVIQKILVIIIDVLLKNIK